MKYRVDEHKPGKLIVMPDEPVPASGSRHRPDPYGAKDKVSQAGFLCAIYRDRAVFAPVPTYPTKPQWVEIQGDLLRHASRTMSVEQLNAWLLEVQATYQRAKEGLVSRREQLIARAIEGRAEGWEIRAARRIAAQPFISDPAAALPKILEILIGEFRRSPDSQSDETKGE